MTNRVSPWKPALAAVALSASFVLMGVWIRLMADSFSSWQQVWSRILVAGLIALAVFGWRIRWHLVWKLRPQDWAVYLVRGVMSYVVGVGLFTIAVQQTQLATVSFVSSLPLMGVLGWLFFREKVKPVAIPFILLSVVGLALLSGIFETGLSLGSGVVAALVGLIGFDIGYLMSRHHPSQLTNFENTTLMLLIGWVPILVVSLLLGEPLLSPHVSAVGWVVLVISGVSNVLGLIAINYIFANMKAYVAGNLLLTEGVIALGIGFWLYHEIPTVPALIGAAIILGCGYALSLIDAKADRLEAVQSEVVS